MGGCLITLSAPGAKRDKDARTTRKGGTHEVGGCLITLSALGAKRDEDARTTREGGVKMSDFITGLSNQLTSSDYTNVNKLKDTMRVVAEQALSQIHHSGIEPQSIMAFHTFARACKVLYRIGAALELYRLGYEFKAVTLN